jgi:hypothetical protein
MSTVPIPADSAVGCANCEAPLGGHYCANCGQEAVLHHASTREFLHEFVGHYVALEGKLWGSLLRLLFRPGLLTNEYIRGRRVRFVQPLRLYLSFSVLFFALLKFTGGSDAEVETEGANTVAKVVAPVRLTARNAAEQQARLSPAPSGEAARGKLAAEAAIADMVKEVGPDKGGSRDATQPQPEPARPKVIEDDDDGKVNVNIEDRLKDWPTLSHQWHAFDQLPREQQWKAVQNGMHHYAPYAIFCLMPVFALFLKVLYLGSGRRFGEHVLFALHTNAFAFFLFGVMLVVPFGLARFVLWCWLIGYLPWAMRRVYHSGRAGTFARWLVLMLLYLLALLAALMISGGMGILSVGH